MKKITSKMVLGWLATASLLITALLPVIDGAPFWVRNALVILGVVVAALTHSPLLQTVPVPEAPKPVILPTNPPPTNGPGGVALVLLVAMVWPTLHGCGGAARITTAAACGTVIVAIGDSRQSPERALADVQSVEAVCRRLHVVPDAGVAP